jgi:hypothetical protein
MKLRNGTEERDGAVAAIMMNLEALQIDYGQNGLKLALKCARGATVRSAMLADYRLTKGGVMHQTVKNVILSAVTDQGTLQKPGA